MPSLFFNTDNNALIVTGKTFHAKEHLKALGGKYSNGTWSLPLNADTPQNRTDLEAIATEQMTAEKAARAAERAYAKSPEGIQAARDAEKAAVKAAFEAGTYWICCENCEVVDWNKKHTYCLPCGYDGNGFRKAGALYTGD